MPQRETTVRRHPSHSSRGRPEIVRRHRRRLNPDVLVLRHADEILNALRGRSDIMGDDAYRVPKAQSELRAVARRVEAVHPSAPAVDPRMRLPEFRTRLMESIKVEEQGVKKGWFKPLTQERIDDLKDEIWHGIRTRPAMRRRIAKAEPMLEAGGEHSRSGRV